jgi:hypothetical protein
MTTKCGLFTKKAAVRPKGLFAVGAGVVLVVLGVAATFAQQMPDPKEIAGIPLPVADLTPGTVVVRVIRGSLANNIANQPVELLGVDPARKVTTDSSGRAEFAGLKPGTRVTAVAVVASERLQSKEFAVPSSGGIRVMLVATDPEAERRAEDDRKLAQGPAQPGMVVLGDQSRFVFELGEDGLSVFNILQVVNTARTPVQPPQPIVFELPAEARGAAVLRGSSPQATVAGRRVTVVGPFAPGATLVQFGYGMPYSGAERAVQQVLPISLARLTVLAQKAGDMNLTSPQVTERREMTAEGQTYIVGQGPAVKAGDVVTFTFSNLPHEPVWPRNLALALVVIILAGGAWASMRARARPGTEDKRRNRLETKRSQLFAELTSVEHQHRAGRLDPQRYATRRGELLSALERVYADLDNEAA